MLVVASYDTVSFLSDGAEHCQICDVWCMHRSGRSVTAQHDSSWPFFTEFGEIEGTCQGFLFQEGEDGARQGVCVCLYVKYYLKAEGKAMDALF